MKTLSRFVLKFTKFIVAPLSRFIRKIFKGFSPVADGSALEGFVDNVPRSGGSTSCNSPRSGPRLSSNTANAWLKITPTDILN
jgi:hypothetical protein